MFDSISETKQSQDVWLKFVSDLNVLPQFGCVTYDSMPTRSNSMIARRRSIWSNLGIEPSIVVCYLLRLDIANLIISWMGHEENYVDKELCKMVEMSRMPRIRMHRNKIELNQMLSNVVKFNDDETIYID